MKEVTVIGFCDGDHEERIRSIVERTIAIDGSKPVMLDLCETCDKIIEGMLILMEHGAVVKGGSKKSSSGGGGSRTSSSKPTGAAFKTSIPFEGPHICPECQFESVSRQALGQHLSVKHNKRFSDYKIED
jgi:hypothetical protein